MSDQRVPPDVPALLRRLRDHDVAFVLAGSVAVEAWGAPVGTPGDLDIVPAVDRQNLTRLAGVLDAVEARAWPVTGRWVAAGNGFRWEEYAPDDPRRGQPSTAPNPDDAATFDSLFATRHGELDIVPRISGLYDDVIQRASRLTVRGVDGVAVLSIEDLLSHLTVPRRARDAPRVAHLRERQRQRLGGRSA